MCENGNCLRNIQANKSKEQMFLSFHPFNGHSLTERDKCAACSRGKATASSLSLRREVRRNAGKTWILKSLIKEVALISRLGLVLKRLNKLSFG